MPYTLQRLAAGSYNLILDEKVIGSVVQDVTAGGNSQGWRAELLSDASPLPKPFVHDTHEFGTLDGVTQWLGNAAVMEEG